MTKQEIINKIATLEAEVEAVSEKRHQIQQSIDKEVREVLTTYLKEYNVLQDGFKLNERSGGEYWDLGRVREEGKRETEELTLNFYHNWQHRNLEYSDIQVRFYTTSENSTYELQRMVMIGKVGQMLLNKKDAILEQINDVKRKCAKAFSEANSTLFDKNKELSELKKQVTEWEKLERLNKATQEGVEFKEEFYKRKFNVGSHEFWGVKKLKAVPTGSGKTCKLEVTTANYGTYEYHTKVKTEALKEALTYYRERIVS